MQNSTRIRKHRTPAQREKLLQDYRRSQMTQKEFASQAGLSVSSLQTWLRKTPASEGPAFVAMPNLFSTTPEPPAYRLQWPGGLGLEVGSGFSPQELAALLQLLPKL